MTEDYERLIRRVVCLLAVLAMTTTSTAQRADYSKLSPMLQRIGRTVESGKWRAERFDYPYSQSNVPRKTYHPSPLSICAFIQLTDDGDETLRQYGCKNLAQFGNIYIADIPIHQLPALSMCANVTRIEARESHTILLDTTQTKLNLQPIYAGTDLPQAFTGRGVVVGLEDIGFDTTHPTFRSSDGSELRIRRFWDQLSTDTLTSELYVGAEYTTEEDILAYGHSRDGLSQYHGTHTLGIAAGNGFGTPYRGVAWESDICIVSNAVNDSKEFIREEDLYKYTSATDVLGFEYILNYAESRGMPCVVSFSEGSHQDFVGDDVLMYAVLDSLTGPGRIIVASAGNEGHYSTYLHKPKGTESIGTYITNGPNNAFVTLRATGDFDLAVRFYIDKEAPYTHLLHSKDIIAEPDSLVEDTLQIGDEKYIVLMAGYPSCYNEAQNAFEVYVEVAQHNFGYSVPVELEIMGTEAEVEVFRVAGKFKYKDMLTKDDGPGEASHSIYSPGSAPAVICVGATSYRQEYTDINGKKYMRDWGADGVKASYSSVGPTFDNRTKPDVMANGTNVISAGNSFYLEEHNQPNVMYVYTDMSEVEGRLFPWRIESGTSMSTPAVAGTIALWLQAKPDLTPEEVREVLANTCRPLPPSSEGEGEGLPIPNNQWGYGEIDAYRGLLYVLGFTGIKDISQQQPRIVRFNINDNGMLELLIDHPTHTPIRLSVYSTDGKRQMDILLPEGQNRYTADMSRLPHGVYAIQLNTKEAGIRGSSLVRR